MDGSMSTTSAIMHYYTSLPLFELLAVLTSVLYVVLAAKGSIWCWPAAIISTILYTVIFFNVYLWMDSLLQLYYLLMAVYGWFCWQQNTHSSSTLNKPLLYSQWSLRRHSIIILVLTLVSLALGWLMANFTPTHFPYLDSATTVFSVFATYLITQKVIENWLYFIVIDIISIYLYIEKDLLPTAVLFGSFVIFAFYGYLQWRKHYKMQFRQQHNDICTNSSITN